MSEVIDHVAVLMVHAARQRGGSLNAFMDSFTTEFGKTYELEISPQVISAAFAKILRARAGKNLPSSLAGDLVQITSTQILELFGDQARIPSSSTPVEYDGRYEAAHQYLPILEAYVYGGDEWINRVIDRLHSGDYEGIVSVRNRAVQIPAADRIVSLDHNSASLEELKEAASALHTQLVKGNDLGGLSVDEAAVAALEVARLEADLSQEMLRLDGFSTRAKSTLSWIGQQAAGTLVGSAALALLALVASYFGLAF